MLGLDLRSRTAPTLAPGAASPAGLPGTRLRVPRLRSADVPELSDLHGTMHDT